MMKRSRSPFPSSLALALLLVAAVAGPGQAATSPGPGAAGSPGAAPGGAPNPDWPCVQRLVPELTAAQMWQGQPLDQLPADAKLDSALAGLPARLADRSVPLDQAKAELDTALAKLPEGQRETQRALLFRATLALINQQRGQVIEGIKSFAHRQRALADKISADGRQLVKLRRDPDQATAVADLTSERAWDMRIFDERQHTMRALCDQPVQLEQRTFALARILQGHAP